MKEEKVKIGVYLPKKLYAELRERQLYDHASFLFTRLLEEFFKTDVRISWSTLTNRKDQRKFLEQKLQEFFSREPKPLPKQEEQVKQVEEQSTHEQKVNVDEIKIDYDQFW